jgi:hypothetical protein
VTFTTERPNSEEDLILVFFSVGFIAISSGRVTNFSTSSALLPGHCDIMVTDVLVTSGKASILMVLKLIYPATASRAVTKNMKNLFFKANERIFFINRFMFISDLGISISDLLYIRFEFSISPLFIS